MDDKKTAGSKPKSKIRCRVWVTYHPSAVLRGGFNLEKRIVEDLNRYKQRKLVAPKDAPPGKNERVIGFDTEYAPDSTLLTTAIASTTRARAWDLAKPIRKSNRSDDIWKALRPILKKAKNITGHNVTGDIDYLVKYKLAKETWLRGEDVSDSLLLARMVDENRGRGAYGLEALLLSEFNFTPWKAETEKLFKKDPDASKWPVELRKERCRLDAWASLILAEHFRRKL